jgi:hypothetical protein
MSRQTDSKEGDENVQSRESKSSKKRKSRTQETQKTPDDHAAADDVDGASRKLKKKKVKHKKDSGKS